MHTISKSCHIGNKMRSNYYIVQGAINLFGLVLMVFLGWLFSTIFSILGFMKMFKAQKKYNDGIF